VVAEIVYAALSPGVQAAVNDWATTSVANLEHEPAGPLLASAFVGHGNYLAWPLLIALAVFGANRALGSAKTAVICLAGHVMGTLVSEGIVAYRVDAGQLPVSYRHLLDLGPSYVVMSAIMITLLSGTWPARLAAALDLAILVFIGDVFAGLTRLDVPAVGHLTAAIAAAALTAAVTAASRRGRATSAASPPAGTAEEPASASLRDVPDAEADQVRDPGRERAEDQLPQRAAPE
jgi:hypothetical protein